MWYNNNKKHRRPRLTQEEYDCLHNYNIESNYIERERE